MNRLKDIWGGQDDMNRVLLLIAVAVFAWSLIEGHGVSWNTSPPQSLESISPHIPG